MLEIEPRRRKGSARNCGLAPTGSGGPTTTADPGNRFRRRSTAPRSPPLNVPPRITRCLFVGTSLGKIFRSMDGGVTWSGNLANAAIPQRLITRIGTHPTTASYVGGDGGERRSGHESGATRRMRTFLNRTIWALPGGVLLTGCRMWFTTRWRFETRDHYRLFVGRSALGRLDVWMAHGG